MSPRRALHRAFLRWLEQNHGRFAVPVKLGRRTDCVLEFAFAGITGAISGALTTWEIEIYVEWEGETWDIILDCDAIPKRAPGGYVCDLCPADAQSVFRTRAALWADHLFEPLLAWVNDKLAPAQWLVLEGRPDSMTRASLAETMPDPADPIRQPVILVPTRVADAAAEGLK